MHKKSNINFVGNIRKYIILSLSIFLIGIVIAIIFGVNMDINFKGGSRFTYTYTGEIAFDDVEKTVEDVVGQAVEISQSTDITGGSTKLVVSLVADESLTAETQQKITQALVEKYPDNQIALGDSNTVNPSIARSFFEKSLFAVLLAGLLVTIYIGIRFRKIGGISAGIMALVALLHDVLIAFFTCVIFRLQIDANFMAVVLTIFGYSLNDTVVIYDRIRENKRLNPKMKIRELTNGSINQTLGRTLTTAGATFLAILTVCVVSEFFGLTTLRSFAIPMAVGVISGSYSTICLAGPLWVMWCEHKEKKVALATGSKKKKK